MGVVYKARDTHLDRLVAVKVLQPEKVADPGRKHRFIQEAKSASALNHPNIIHVYDVNQSDGTDFIVMEHVAGKTLDELIPRKGMRLSHVLKYALQIADALTRAHAAGIVHRDLKPSNVMVDERGMVKVLDFGLAKLTEAAGPEAETISKYTAEGVIVGTPAYMSPEQAEGRDMDVRSDIFSFGSVLYEMVTGHPAFESDSRMSTLAAIINREPVPLGGLVPHDLEKLITRCLRKDPERRIQHMDDIKLALEELKEESDSGKLSPALALRRNLNRGLIWAVTLLILVGGAFAVWYFLLSRQTTVPAFNPAPLTSYPGFEQDPCFSPDGTQIAFSWNGEKQDNFDIYVTLIGAGGPLRLTADPARDFSPAWSPDGRTIAFLRSLPGERAAVLLIPPLGGAERKVAEVRGPVPYMNGPYVTWSPDGTSLVIVDSASSNEALGLFRLLPETGEKRRLTTPPGPTQGDTGPAFSPDGSTLVFDRMSGAANNDLYLMAIPRGDAQLEEPRRLTFDNWNTVSPAWLGSSEILFSSTRRRRDGIWRTAASGSSQPEKMPFADQEVTTLAISLRANRLVYTRLLEDTNLWLVEATTGRTSGPLASSTRIDDNPQFSPDGKRIAFRSLRSGTSEIWICDSNGANAVQLTSMEAPSTGTPRWSPDGLRVAFDSNLEGQNDVYVVSADGGKPQRLTNDPANDAVPSWARDGKWIYFRSNRSGQDQIWKFPAEPKSPPQPVVRVTRNGGFVAFESIDGNWLYYTKQDGVSSLWKMPVEGGEEIQVLPAVARRSFAILADGIYFMKPLSVGNSLEFLSFASGKARSIASIKKPLALGLTVYAGQGASNLWILYAQVDQSGSDLILVDNFRR